MVTMVSILTKCDEMNHKEFADRWTQEHSPIAEDLPGLQRYVTVVPDNPDEAPHDGVAILTFENREALDSAFESPQGRKADEDVSEFTKSTRRMFGTETVHVG